jgi:putative membrane protein
MHRFTSVFAFAVLSCAALALAQDQPAGPGSGQDPDPAPLSRDQGLGRDQDRNQDRDRDAATAGQRERGGDVNMDQDFVKHAISGNLLEVQLGQLVSQKAQDPQIKQFAQRLVEDHRKANEQLKQVAQQMNVQVSDQLLPVHQAKLDHFQQKQGKPLEIGFIFDQVGMHAKDVLEYQYVAQNAQNPQLKQLAAQALPHLREHLQMAQRIAPGGNEARTAGERVGGGASDTGAGHGAGHGGTSGDRDRDR